MMAPAVWQVGFMYCMSHTRHTVAVIIQAQADPHKSLLLPLLLLLLLFFLLVFFISALVPHCVM